MNYEARAPPQLFVVEITCQQNRHNFVFRFGGVFLLPRLPLRSGVNSCIFAYGQTGSGKTYSMMGDMPKLWMEKSTATTNNDGIERLATDTNSMLGTAGVIPRAVYDIFRIVRQGGVREELSTSPLPSASGPYSFRESPEGPPPPSAETVPPPSTARGSSCASTPNTPTPGTSHSFRSSGTSSSEDSSIRQVPSAAHWPLSEPFVYIPRAQGDDTVSTPAGQRVRRADDSKTCDAVTTEKPRACRQNGEQGGTTMTCKYSVQCSYVQVRFSPSTGKKLSLRERDQKRVICPTSKNSTSPLTPTDANQGASHRP